MDWPFARTMIVEDVAESTSDLARRLVLDGGAELPLVVRALRQTRGRGRGTHAWWSDAGSLTFTIAIDPAAHGLRAEHEARLALASAVAIIDALGPIVPALGIRWPNDVEVAGRKLAGILPERILTSEGPRLLIGIGLNVATRLDDAPPEVRRMATSVVALRAVPLGEEDVVILFREILEHVAGVMPRLASDDPELVERWNQLDTLAGRWVRVEQGTRIVAGRGQGIDAGGGLRLAGEDGLLVVYGGHVLRSL